MCPLLVRSAYYAAIIHGPFISTKLRSLLIRHRQTTNPLLTRSTKKNIIMTLPVYIVDAFPTKLFGGNPAAVCPLSNWLPDDVMQSLAAENNLAETVFFVKEPGLSHTLVHPAVEVKLCGHTTLASAFVMYAELGYTAGEIVFNSLNGPLRVSRHNNGKLQLDFPASMGRTNAGNSSRQ